MWKMRTRPILVAKDNIVRQAPDQGPKPPGDERAKSPSSQNDFTDKEQQLQRVSRNRPKIRKRRDKQGTRQQEGKQKK